MVDIWKFPDFPLGSKLSEIKESDSEEKIGIWDMDFPQGHVGKRDLKRKCEGPDDFMDSKESIPPFPLFEARP